MMGRRFCITTGFAYLQQFTNFKFETIFSRVTFYAKTIGSMYGAEGEFHEEASQVQFGVFCINKSLLTIFGKVWEICI